MFCSPIKIYRLFTVRELLSELPCICCFLYSNCNCNCSSDHGVVAHADQTHHLNMCRYRRGTCKLSVRVHTS